MGTRSFTLTTPALERDQRISTEYTCDGANTPPPMQWSHAPEATRSLALIMDDPDAPNGTFTHWLLWDIAPRTDTDSPVQLEGEGVPGRNDFQGIGYGGPCPPHNHGDHHYRFHLYALDVDSLELDEGATREEMERAMQGHVITDTEVVGLYAR